MHVRPSDEEPTRRLIGHVIRGELDELEQEIQQMGDDAYRESLALCVLAAGYIVVDVAERWPADADVREIARHASASSETVELGEDDAYTFLSRAALGGETLDQVFESVKDIAGVPLWTTSALLLGFRPRDKHWWEYLDTIWNALDAAEDTDLSILPALMLRSKRLRTAAK